MYFVPKKYLEKIWKTSKILRKFSNFFLLVWPEMDFVAFLRPFGALTMSLAWHKKPLSTPLKGKTQYFYPSKLIFWLKVHIFVAKLTKNAVFSVQTGFEECVAFSEKIFQKSNRSISGMTRDSVKKSLNFSVAVWCRNRFGNILLR